MIDINQLQTFLYKAQLVGYASAQETKFVKEKDSSTTIEYEDGAYKYHDNYFGGEPYGGRSVVFYNTKPLWMMVYYGTVATNIDSKSVYHVLRNALKLTPSDFPVRGPNEYCFDDFIYRNNWEGTLSLFSGQEFITKNKERIYFARYMGGLVDQPRKISL
jgi:hypothetical protein